MAQTEQALLDTLARAKALYAEIERQRTTVATADNAWADALTHLDEAISSLGLGVYLVSEHLADQDQIEAGDATRLPNDDVLPVLPDSRR